jgi:hypothetical protein
MFLLILVYVLPNGRDFTIRLLGLGRSCIKKFLEVKGGMVGLISLIGI